jgi:glycosyltransferase involved in cell wall biosynthesis
MRNLQVCLKPPYPAHDGGCMAIAAITEGLLAEGYDLNVLCMATDKHPFNKGNVPEGILKATKMEAVQMDVRVKPMAAFLNLFSSKSYNITRFYSREFETRLIEILNESAFDIVHLESIFCLPYLQAIRSTSKAKVVVRAHNIEHIIWQRLAEQESNIFKKAYLNLLSKRLKAYEISELKNVDGIVPISEEDRQGLILLGVHVPMEVIPMGMSISVIAHEPLSSGALQLYHVGSMDWQPNVEAVEFFIKDIWPVIHSNHPDVSCHFAGRNMTANLLSQHKPPLHLHGEVASVPDFAADKQIMLVPVLSGGGMRIKIVEAMTMGKVVVSTTIGAEGIPYKDGEHLLIANTPNEFVQQLSWLKANPLELQRIGDNARRLAEVRFDTKATTSRLTYFYRSIL